MAGSPGQTIRYADTSWVADSFLINTGSRIGIGVDTPLALIHAEDTAKGKGSVLFVGNFNESDPGTPPLEGAGTRMMWYPDKAAFRVGRVGSTYWDQDSIGNYSVATGNNTRASGNYSNALGYNCEATSAGSVAMGYWAHSTAMAATATGYHSSARGYGSTAMGRETDASGTYSMACNMSTEAPSYAETAFGSYTLNYSPVDATSFNRSDRLFVIGNGTSAMRHNVLTILKNGKVGIGTVYPTAGLHVGDVADSLLGDGNVLFENSYLTMAARNPPREGAGQRFMWYADKVALRSGVVLGTAWDKANIGDASVAFGVDCKASGTGSFAWGTETEAGNNYSTAWGWGTSAGLFATAWGRYDTASGEYSTAWGNRNRALGNESTAWGYDNYVLGNGSTAWGYQNKVYGAKSSAWGQNNYAAGDLSTAWGSTDTAGGVYATAWGHKNNAMGLRSTAWGYKNYSFGETSTAWGEDNEATGLRSTAWGIKTEASATNSTALGYLTIASGHNSVAMGKATIAPSFCELAIGEYNLVYTPTFPNLWSSSDRVFTIGIGTSSTARANAMTVLKDGRIGIGTDSPTALLHTYGAETGGGNVLFSGLFKTSSPGDPPVSGTGTRMMWYPDKAAFRVGYVSGTLWDRNSVGNYSFAAGKSTTASGSTSIALGNETTASGANAVALGYGSTASNTTSTALGYGAVASGIYAVAMGEESTASGKSALACNRFTTAPSYAETVIGQYNETYSPSGITSFQAADRLFVIGNGTSAAARSNALTVLKNGNIGIGTSDPGNNRLYVKYSSAYPTAFIENTNSNGIGLKVETTSTDGTVLVSQKGAGYALRCDNWDPSWHVSFIIRGDNVGLGMSYPTYQLQLSSNSAGKPSSSSWTITSDIRLKDVSGNYHKGLAELLQLQPIVYRYKKDNPLGITETDKDAYGFSAQEVQKVFPEAVGEKEGYLNLDMHPLLVAQVNANRELNEKIEAQVIAIRELNEKIKAQEDASTRIDRQQQTIDQLILEIEQLKASFRNEGR
jgi:hypothetical protein